MRALSLLVCCVVTVAHAEPAEQTITVRLANGKAPAMGPAPRPLSENASSFPQLTADGARVVVVEKEVLVARELPGGKPREFGRAPGWFRETPDGTRLVTLGPAAVWSFQATDGGQPLEETGTPTRAIVNNAVAVATLAAGPMVVIDLASGAKRALPIEPPADKRCHNGHGLPYEVSDDGKWLLYQHGCAYQAMRLDGSKSRELGFASATLVGTVVTGDVRPEGSSAEPTSLVVMELNTGARWSIEGVRLHPTFWRLPGTEHLVMLGERGRLLLVELRMKKVTVLRDAAPRAVTASVRPDGRLLVVTRDDKEHTCGVLELDPTSRKSRKLLDASAIDQCFAHPTLDGGAIVMAWRWEPTREVVLVELDPQGNARQLGPAMADIGNLSASGGRWLFQPRGKPGFLFTAP